MLRIAVPVLTCGIIIVLSLGLAAAQCPLGDDWHAVPNQCMMCGTTKKNVTEARTACENRGGRLASILNQDQLDFGISCTDDLTSGNGEVWVGLKIRETSSGYDLSWEDGHEYNITIDLNNPTSFGNLCFAIERNTTGSIVWLESGGCQNQKYYVCSTGQVTCQAIIETRGSNVSYSRTTGPYYPGDVATYSCDAGYELAGDVAGRTCQNDGTWSGKEPECSRVDCGPLGAPANGGLSLDAMTYNSIAVYSCNTGYTLNSTSSTRICQANATWTGTDLACVFVNCTSLPNPSNGAVTTPSITYGSIATYSCNEGYVLDGDEARTCMASGFWSGAQPSCEDDSALSTTEVTVLASAMGGVALLGSLGTVLYLMFRRPPVPQLPAAPVFDPRPVAPPVWAFRPRLPGRLF